jgi:kynurenine formamidase
MRFGDLLSSRPFLASAFVVGALATLESPAGAAGVALDSAARPAPPLQLAGAGDRGSTPLDLAGARVVDLSHGYGPETLFWPSSPPAEFRLQVLHAGQTDGGYYYAANSFCMPEHGGTHLDAPVHFAEGKWGTADVPLDRLVAPAAVIDVREKAAADADYRLSRDDIFAWEARHGTVPRGAIVLLRTGWSERWPDRLRYFGSASRDDSSGLHFPSFGAEAAALLLERGAVALGVDTASIDHGPSRDYPVHRAAGAANVPGLENLTNLGELPPTGAWLVALPMKIEGGSGGPLRAIALVPR